MGSAPSDQAIMVDYINAPIDDLLPRDIASWSRRNLGSTFESLSTYPTGISTRAPSFDG